ncbi:MAG: ATP-binding protein [Candidatus Promineifilaceae bacterium]|nr:ATP-binding protein [Candidatus Promineifilaceae bacterium]
MEEQRFRRLRQLLLDCAPLGSNDTMRALFADPRLRPWQNALPDAATPTARAEALLDLLDERRREDGTPALALLLEALADRVDPADACHPRLSETAAAVAARAAAPRPGESPYKGLHHYEVEDAARFFGRERLVERLAGQLQRAAAETGSARFLAVVGASGSGKSSLLRAGLVPALAAGGPRWPYHIVTPGAEPLKALALELTQGSESVRASTVLIDDMSADERSLDLYAHRMADRDDTGAANGDPERIVLVVDQFEELFTHCEDEAVRQAYVGNLARAATADGPLAVVLALRADFYHRCADYDALRELLANHQIYIGPMARDELERAITEPAEAEKWYFEEGLVARILDDVGQEPGALPLVSHALQETWRRREERTLTHEGYSAAGEVQGAIARTAESLYTSLDQDEQALARRLLLQLVALGRPGEPDTRRRASRSELRAAGPSAEAASPGGTVDDLLERLVEGRLLIVGRQPVPDEAAATEGSGGGYAEVAHEALIRRWPRLQGWLEEERERLRVQRRIRAAAESWLELDRDKGALLRGLQLVEAEAWAEAEGTAVDALVSDFLSASRAEARRERFAARAPYYALVGGAVGFFLAALVAPSDVVSGVSGGFFAAYLLFQAALHAALGAGAGVALVRAAPRDDLPRAALAGAAIGAALLLVRRFVFTREFLALALALVQGALWGAVVGAGYALILAARLEMSALDAPEGLKARPAWQLVLAASLLGALVLAAGEPLLNSFGDAAALPVFPAGLLLTGGLLGSIWLAAR